MEERMEYIVLDLEWNQSNTGKEDAVPLWVPSGTVYSTLPSMEGTVTLSPSTA